MPGPLRGPGLSFPLRVLDVAVIEDTYIGNLLLFQNKGTNFAMKFKLLYNEKKESKNNLSQTGWILTHWQSKPN